MEYRTWSNPLSESVFENHTLAPQSYNGNSFYASYDNMLLRWKLDKEQDYADAACIAACRLKEDLSESTENERVFFVSMNEKFSCKF